MWFTAVLNFMSSIITGIFWKAQGSPAIKEVVDAEEGNLAPVRPNDFDGLYGVRNRDQRNKDDCVCESKANSRNSEGNPDGGNE